MSKTLITAGSTINELALRNTVIAFKANTTGTLQLSVKVDDGVYVNFGDTFTGDMSSISAFSTAVVKFTVTGDGVVAVYHDEYGA